MRKRRHTGRGVSVGTFEFLQWSLFQPLRAFGYGLNTLRGKVSHTKPSNGVTAPGKTAPPIAPALDDLAGVPRHVPGSGPAVQPASSPVMTAAALHERR
ncbi:MAG: hypothetical protein AAGM04_10655, partial [Pseudomonadota bacterium]